MNQDYRWFRQDELLRKCVITNVFFSSMTSGFETFLEPRNQDGDPEEYRVVKERIDEINKQVNMDLTLFCAQIKRGIYGKSGFEIILDGDGYPSKLLSLQSPRLKPNLDQNWELTGYRYEGRDGFYNPEEVLYFQNLGLEADYEGLSEVEPIRGVCSARHELLRENFPEIVRSLWAPYVILQANTAGLSQEEAENVIDNLARVARAGKSLAINESVTPTVVHLTPDITGLCNLLENWNKPSPLTLESHDFFWVDP
jgi:hypothetical protein